MSQACLSIPVIGLLTVYVAARLLMEERTLPLITLCGAILAVAGVELGDLLSMMTGSAGLAWKRQALVAESLLPATWLMCSVSYARNQRFSVLSRLQKGLIASALPLVAWPFIADLDTFFYAPDFPSERILFLNTAGFFFYGCLAVLLVVCLVNFETTLTNASPGALWQVKFDILGLGAIVAVLLFYYSQGLVYRTINMYLLPVRSLVLFAAGGVLIYGRFRHGGRVRITISRQMAFKSVVLFVVGIYLVMVGLLGEGLKYFGATIQRTAAITFCFLVGIGLVSIFLSEQMRRGIKVYLHKHFYQNKYDYRTQWLQFTERLAVYEDGAELQREILAVFAETFGTKGALLFLTEGGQGDFVNTAAYEVEPVTATIAGANRLVRYMVERHWVFASRDDNPEILAENREFLVESRASFIIPLFGKKELAGFIVLGQPINQNESYIYEDFDLMKTIARQASFAILNQRLSLQLSQAREMEAIGKVSAFVIHDLKNHVAALSLMLENAGLHIRNPEFQQDMLRSLGNTVKKIQGLIGRLKNLGEKELFNLQPVELSDFVQKTVAQLGVTNIHVQGEKATALADADELQKVLLNLVLNGVEASSPLAPIIVTTGQRESRPFVRVRDQGAGMATEFIRDMLFKPFMTTKRKGLGIGLYQCRQIIEAHGGRIEVESCVGIGSTFTILLPTPTEGTSGSELASSANKGFVEGVDGKTSDH
jgi:putative PEP-CTERM system histidine kinase